LSNADNLGNPQNSRAADSPAKPPRPPLSARWTYIVLALTLLFILLPFLFWRATWFGRPLTNAQLADYLNPASNAHDIQHGLSQVADRIVRHDPSVKTFYPQVIALSSSPHTAIRTMAAWTMGQDNQSPQFHAALLPMLNDSDVNVRRNAALALVRFHDSSGHAVIVAMLKPALLDSAYAGTLRARLKPGESLNTDTLVAQLQTPTGEKDIRSEIPGTLNRWLVNDGVAVTAGEPIATILPSDDEVWEGLRALFLIGTPADLDAIAPYARGGGDAPPQLAEQARMTMQEIQARASVLPGPTN